MNILIVNSGFHGGGAEKVARQLFYGLQNDYGVHALFVAGKSYGLDDNYASIYDYDKTVIRLCNRARNLFSNNARTKDHFSRGKLLSMIQKNKIDLVHFHNIHGNYIGIEDIGKISQHCRVVWTLHDMWAFTGHCAYALECGKWVSDGCKACPGLQLYPRMFIDRAHKIYKTKQRAFVNKNVIYVTPSQWLMEQCSQTFLTSEQRYLIHNGVDAQIFYPMDRRAVRKKYCIAGEKTVLLFAVNNIDSPYKGADILKTALESIPNKEDYELIIVGNGSYCSLGNGYLCHNIGYVSDESRMNELYNLADVFILPSRAENFPCSVLESMAAGTPVIGSQTGGVVEQIDDQTGWMFPVGDSQRLAEIIGRLPYERKKLSDMRIQCRKKIVRYFSKETMIRKYYELYIDDIKRE